MCICFLRSPHWEQDCRAVEVFKVGSSREQDGISFGKICGYKVLHPCVSVCKTNMLSNPHTKFEGILKDSGRNLEFGISTTQLDSDEGGKNQLRSYLWVFIV